MIDFTLAYSALPCAVLPPTAQKPVTPRALRACLVASDHFFSGLEDQAFLLRADAPLATILPRLFFAKLVLVNPPTVLSLLPLSTAARANFPLAILLMAFVFMTLTFVAFLAAFMAGAFMAAFMATPFIAFIATAIPARTMKFLPQKLRL